jgi:hypothetical protein
VPGERRNAVAAWLFEPMKNCGDPPFIGGAGTDEDNEKTEDFAEKHISCKVS